MLINQSLDIDIYDAAVINLMRNSDREKQGKGKLVSCDPRIMYQIHGQKCRDITRMWIRLAMFDASQLGK